MSDVIKVCDRWTWIVIWMEDGLHTNNLGNSLCSIICPSQAGNSIFPLIFTLFLTVSPAGRELIAIFFSLQLGEILLPHTLCMKTIKSTEKCLFILTMWADILSKRKIKSIMTGSDNILGKNKTFTCVQGSRQAYLNLKRNTYFWKIYVLI